MTKTRHRILRRSPAALHPALAHDDAFFRHIVSGLRNGVLAITRDGTLALINDEACRIFGVTSAADNLGKPVAEVLRAHPDIVRVLNTVFDLHMLPNRVELRLRPSKKVIGYTLTLVRNDEGEVVGAAMFFKDLTRVEQLEERERLRDRLIAVGEMAAAIAHEVKNPLAGIEVMAGLLRRKIQD
jgi:PAS domain S-box-containing protein